MLGALLLGSCGETPQRPEAGRCDGEVTPITDVQGADWYSPLRDRPVTVRGVVTALEPGRGFYLEEPGDGRPGRASRALFVADDGRLGDVRPGQERQLGGLVTESGVQRARVISKRGRYNPSTREMLAMGEVVLTITEGDKRVESEELNYDPNGDRIWSDSATTMIEY